jgi:hypothetical protein
MSVFVVSSIPFMLLEFSELSPDTLRQYLAQLPGHFPRLRCLLKNEYRKSSEASRRGRSPVCWGAP